MTSTPNPGGFTDSDELPTGRKAREVSEHLMAALADSARRSVAKVREAEPAVIDELRRDLGSAKVRAKYIVTQETEKLKDDLHKLKFSARVKPTAVAAPDAKAASK